MISRLHLVVCVVMIALGCASAGGAAPGSVSGVVRDSAGVPQIGAQVQLLRSDLSVVVVVYTNGQGRFSISSIYPGRYSVKAIGSSFLPSMREGVRVRSNTIVNLTLNTLYEVMQWLPAEPRSSHSQQDDWMWTLRSAANRPLLRWLEDGPLVVVSDGSGAPKLKARLMATGQEGSFGENGERFSATVEDTPTSSRELLARVDFDPQSNEGLESMLGFRQDLGYAGSVQTLAAISIQPSVETSGEEESGEQPNGLDEAAVVSQQMIRLGDELEAEAGSEQVVARFDDHSAGTVAAALPYVSVTKREGNSAIGYRMTTMLPGVRETDDADDTEAQAWMPRVSARNGKLLLEHGLHQEIGWERRTENSGMALRLFADHIDHPVIEAMGRFAEGGVAMQNALLDSTSGLLRAAGSNYSTAGFLATVERSLPGGNQILLSYGNGDVLRMPAPQAVSASTLAQVLTYAHPHRAQEYSISLSGTLDGTGTRWRASYRWQPSEAMTQVAPFAAGASEPYLNIRMRQPLHLRCGNSKHVEAILEMRNLLAEGYRPYLLSDGSLLVLDQDQRSFSGGMAFTF
jgi:hypothetical protein